MSKASDFATRHKDCVYTRGNLHVYVNTDGKLVIRAVPEAIDPAGALELAKWIKETFE